MRNKRNILQISVLLTTLIIAYFAIKSTELYQVIRQLEGQVKAAEEKLEQETEALTELQTERNKMDTLEYIEEVAREKLGMVKPDDIVFRKK